ncbi:MAG: LPS export ABC transporter periplasmic protein LptC [Flavobacteriales bacterium]|nr:LPS export ABC transporter periplasmic protein LptC [Flavobacteriales bacterium]
MQSIVEKLKSGFTSFAFLMLALLFACRNDIAEINAFADTASLPVQTSYNAEYLFTDNGKISNRLIAAQLDQYDGKENYFEASGGFNLIFYDSLQKEEARLKAKTGRYYEKEKRLLAQDSVELYNIRGEKLETSKLTFVQDSGKIFTDEYVVITLKNGSMLHGYGLESNDSFTKYKIKKPSGDFIVTEEESLK